MYFDPQFQTAKPDTPHPQNTPEIDENSDSHNAPAGKAGKPEDTRLRFPAWRRSAFYV